MTRNKIALFTTVYPEGEKYLVDWYNSVKLQDDLDFDIWIGCDRLSIDDAIKSMKNIKATWITKRDDESVIKLRERAIRLMVPKYFGIVFVDSDDILEDSRVSTARNLLDKYDVYGCAMRIIDESGKDMGINFTRPKDVDIRTLLFNNNIFGLSNTAYRTSVLAKCLPFPKDCELLDWFLVTRALIQGANIYFDDTIRMKYRQHNANIARVIPPFSKEQILMSTKKVLHHYDLILSRIPELQNKDKSKINSLKNYIEDFYNSIILSPEKLNLYVIKMNTMPTSHIWWSCVAHPALEETVWKS